MAISISFGWSSPIDHVISSFVIIVLVTLSTVLLVQSIQKNWPNFLVFVEINVRPPLFSRRHVNWWMQWFLLYPPFICGAIDILQNVHDDCGQYSFASITYVGSLQLMVFPYLSACCNMWDAKVKHLFHVGFDVWCIPLRIAYYVVANDKYDVTSISFIFVEGVLYPSSSSVRVRGSEASKLMFGASYQLPITVTEFWPRLLVVATIFLR